VFKAFEINSISVEDQSSSLFTEIQTLALIHLFTTLQAVVCSTTGFQIYGKTLRPIILHSLEWKISVFVP